MGVGVLVFHLQSSSTPSITYPWARSKSTRKANCSDKAPPRAVWLRAPPLMPAQPRCSTRAPHLAAGWPCASRLRSASCVLRVLAGPAKPGHAPAPYLQAAASKVSVLGHLTAAVAHAPKTFSHRSSEPWGPRPSAPQHPRPSRCGDLPLPRLLGAAQTGGQAAGSTAVRSVASRVRGSSWAEETWTSSGPMAGRRRGSARACWPRTINGTRAF